MTNKVQMLRVMLALVASITIVGCGTTALEPTAVPSVAPAEEPTVEPTVAPTEAPTAVPTETPLQVPDPVSARGAALEYVGQKYDQQVPAPDAGWLEEDITKEGLVGASTLRYTTQEWTVTVAFPIVLPSLTIYTVTAVNETTGFEWEGEVDAMGQVTELAVAEVADVRFEGVSFSYDPAIASNVVAALIPASGEDEPDWAASPEHLEFSFEGYALEGTFHEPRIYAYRAAELEAASDMGAAIVGAVRHALAERPAVAPPNSMLPGFNAAQLFSAQTSYLDFASGSGVRYLTQMAQAYYPINNTDLFYAFQGLTADGEWYIAAVLPTSHPSLAADGSEIPGGDFNAFAENFETYAAEVAAQLDAEAPESFTPNLSLLDAMMASVRVAASEPASRAGLPVVAWGGFVKAQPEGAQFDDCLALEPEGAGEVGLTGADSAVVAQIQALRDSGTYAHFWGMLFCPAVDCGGCQLVVERLREDRPGPLFTPDPVDGWEGMIVGLPEGAQFDDYFVLAGELPVGFGVDGAYETIIAELANVRDTGAQVRIWGSVEAGVPDAFGTHIAVERLEVLGQSG